VALSADGSTLIVNSMDGGGRNPGIYNADIIYVYTKPAGGWATSDAPAAILIEADKSAPAGYRFATLDQDMALSADGSTIVARTVYADVTFWVAVYTRPAGGWANATAPNARLTNTARATNGDPFGLNGGPLESKGLALSPDGSVIFVGAAHNEAVAVFTRPAGGWVSSDTPNATLTDATVTGAGASLLGSALALSADGSTLVAGAYVSDLGGKDRGAVVLFTRPAGGWVSTKTASAILTVASNPDEAAFGFAVALSADGSTLAAGRLGGIRKVVQVYVKPAGGWATTDAPDATLSNATGVDYENFGSTLALSADGSTLVAGVYADTSGSANPGVVAVFTRPAGGWASSDTPTKLSLPSGEAGDRFGNSVALSADGRTLVAGAPDNATGGAASGAAYVYTKPAGGWASSDTPDGKLFVAAGANGDLLGYALALSADGSTLVAGAANNAAGGDLRGAAYIYTKPASSWATTTTPTARLTNAAGRDYDYLGLAVALSADGSIIIASALDTAAGDTQRGARYIYTRPAGGWADTDTPAATLTAAAGADGDGFGTRLALNADGSTIVAGAPFSAGGGADRGALYSYTRPASGWASSVPSAKYRLP
jgi:hypothetical protein